MGETEGNLERILTVLRAMGPVVVVIDEADAALGNRQADGDSGTSSRVFSMLAAQMGDTLYRGKLIWMLMTSRPDLLPIDLKRQGSSVRAGLKFTCPCLPLRLRRNHVPCFFTCRVKTRCRSRRTLYRNTSPAEA